MDNIGKRFLIFTSLVFMFLSGWVFGYTLCRHLDGASLIGRYTQNYPGSYLLVMLFGAEPSYLFPIGLLVVAGSSLFLIYTSRDDVKE